MKRFKKILFVNEPSSTMASAPERAVQIARNNKALLTLCDANPELPRSVPNLQETYIRIHQRQLSKLFENIDLNGVKTGNVSLIGIPFIEIIKEVQRSGHDLLIKSAEGSGGKLSYLFGETDMHLMRKCPCPVWIMKSSQSINLARIYAAVDPDPDVPANAELNQLILELASTLAREENSELHIVHSWCLHGNDMFRSVRSMLSKDEVDIIEQETKGLHEKWFNKLVASYDFTGIVVKTRLVKGEAGKVIPKIVAKGQADLVVMGTVGRTGIAGYFIGNTAEKIL